MNRWKIFLFVVSALAAAACQTDRMPPETKAPAPTQDSRNPAPAQMSPGTQEQPAQTLAAPQQVSAIQGLNTAARRVNFKWSPVEGAAAYGVQVDCYGCCAEKRRWCSASGGNTMQAWTISPSDYSFLFVPKRPGSWRVWAIDNAGHAGLPSEWSVFSLDTTDTRALPTPPSKDIPIPSLPEPLVFQSTNPVDPATGESCRWPIRQPSGSAVTRPKGVRTPDPDYGESSRRYMVNGWARVVVELGADGAIQRVCLLDATQPDLGEQAVKTVKDWTFEPALRNGTPIPYSMVVETSFNVYPWRMR